ncbi:hypothetical protein ACFW04_006539 [Cataglyphis niger]
MTNAKAVATSAEPNTHLSTKLNEDVLEITIPYLEAVGSLIFAACVLRPDIMYPVTIISRYLTKPGTLVSFVYDGFMEDYGLIGFTDTDYAGDPDTRRSIGGYIFTFCGEPVSWMPQRIVLMPQRIVVSTIETKYIAASDATKETIWLRYLLESVGAANNGSTTMKVDNQGDIKLIKNPEYHKRIKHIQVRYYFIREKYDDGQIEIMKYKTHNNAFYYI